MHNGLFIMQNDARISLMEAAYQWVDLDPFGSPVNFLDAAIQGLSRVAFLEVTATDTAALTGSSASSQQRRYGAKGSLTATHTMMPCGFTWVDCHHSRPA